MRKGFTLLETVLAVGIFSLVIGAAMASWLLLMHKSNRAYTQSELDMDVRKMTERFRAEMRNAARETIIFYPENTMPAKAVGFALASDSDGDGLMDMDASGSNILWRQTVVYHVFEKAPTQMRRTLFTNRNNGALYDDYYRQIEQVVTSGDGSGACLPGESASTTVMFENLFSGKLWHADAPFDGYNPQPNTVEKVTFGSLQLGAGEHTVTFKVAGKNALSRGRNIRLDQLSASVSGWPLEAEMRTVTGGSPAPQYVGAGLVGAAYGLSTATAADGEAVSLTVFNDAIEECEFVGKGKNVSLSNTVVRFDSTYQPAGFNAGAFVTKLEGQFLPAWRGGEQSGDGVRSVYLDATNCVVRIPVFGQWVTQDGFGPVFRLYKSLYNKNTQIVSPMYAKLAGPPNGPNVGEAEWIPLMFYQDGQPKASWSACAQQRYVDLRPARTERLYAKTKDEPGTSLMLSFGVSIDKYKEDLVTCFQMSTGYPGCWVIDGWNTNLIAQSVWTTNSATVRVLDRLPTLEMMAVGFADVGDYVSHPFDTKSLAGGDKTVTWDADLPSGSTLTMYGRSGNSLSSDGFNIADAPQWESASQMSSGGTFPGTGRYVQFRAVLSSSPYSVFPGEGGTAGSGPYRSATPRLRRVLINWDGGAKYVDVTANLLKGPDCGLFQVEVDGKPLVQGVTMEIEIFKDVLTQNSAKKERLRSAMMVEIEPRNSAKK